MLGLFSTDVHSSLVARRRKQIKCVLHTLFRGCKQYQIVRKKQTVGHPASNSDTLVDSAVTLSNSYKPGVHSLRPSINSYALY